MSFEIIDFHTHPFSLPEQNICNHKEFCGMSPANTRDIFDTLKFSKICGSVINMNRVPKEEQWSKIRKCNDTALELQKYYGEFYIPGFHIHPDFPDESAAEIHAMHQKGIRLIGELVPYADGWSDYSCDSFSELMKIAGRYNMIVSFHSTDDDTIDKILPFHKDVIFVAAHPGEYKTVMRHIERMKQFENYYLDLSGTGLFRYGTLRRLIDEAGVDRILFGSDFPTCNPAMFLGGVLHDPLISDSEKEMIFSTNAKRLLNI